MKYIPNAVSLKVGRQTLVLAKHSPRLLFGAGVVGVVVTTVLACRATLQLEDVLDEAQADLADSKRLIHSRHPGYLEKKNHAYIYVRSTAKVARLYAPAIAVGTLSIAALTGSHHILSKRNAGLTAAYAAIDKTFGDYRKRVVDELGEDKDKEFRHGKVTREIVEETEKGPKVKTITHVASPHPSDYAKLFTPRNPNWNPTPEYNVFFLRSVQNYCNDKLKANGWILLNDVYDNLGLERTSAGCVVGWKMGNGDNEIDFGIWDTENADQFSNFVTGRMDAILLDFNVDGVIYDQIGKS